MDDSSTPSADRAPVLPAVADGGDPLMSRGLARRHVVMGGALLAVSGLAFARRPKPQYPDISDKQFEAMFPKAFGEWRTNPVSELVMPPEGDLAEKLYQHILTRTYTGPNGQEVMFLVAYNSTQVNNVQLHRPEICYSAAGFNIDVSRPITLDLGGNNKLPARTVKAERATRIENIVYWTRIGDEFPQSWAGQRVSMTKANLEGFYADGMLARMSVLDNDNARSVATMDGFIRELAQNSGPAARKLLFRT